MVCGQTLGEGEAHLCAACLTNLPLSRLDAMEDNAVSRLFFDIKGIEHAASYLVYRHGNAAFQLIHQLKYHDRPDVGEFLGRQMAYHYAETGFFKDIDALVPVPLSKKKIRKRGFNQSEHIARGIAQVTGLPVRTDIVERRIDNPTQTRLNKEERRQNVEGIFGVKDKEALLSLGKQSKGEDGRDDRPHLLLIDDVITTGATLHSLGTALSACGEVRLSYLSVAVAGQHLNVFQKGAE